MTDEQMSKTYTRLVLEGKLRQAVRFITQRDQGGVLQMAALDSKSGLPVLDVLKSKHPDAVIPPPEVLEEYESIPSFVPLDITATTVEGVARKMSGGAGPGGVDSIALQG